MLRFILIFTMIFGSTIPHQQPKEQLLNFVLSADKSTYFTFEPLGLNMTIINRGLEPIQGDFNFLSFSFQQAKLFYRKTGGEFKRYYSLRIWMARGIHDLPGERPMLAPGGVWSRREILLFDTSMEQNYGHRFVLDGPGEYEFKVSFQYVFNNPSKVVESNILSLTVVNPPEEEQKALALWQDRDLALALQGDKVGPEAVTKLRGFMQKFPTSLYAKAVRVSSERLLSHLAQKAKVKELTEDEKALYQLLRPNN